MRKKNLEEEITDYVIKFKDNHYRLAYSYVRNADDALDIVQESIYKAFSSIDSLKDASYIKTWFYRIIVNTSLDSLRRRKNVVTVEEDVLSRYDSGSLDSYEDIDLKKELDQLPNNYKSIIVLRYFEDCKIEEVAEILNLNINTVKTRLYQGLRKLRIKMDIKNEEEVKYEGQ